MPESPEASLNATSSGPALVDFPDRLPPVLVKELRQGLRGRMFVIPFLVLQGLLILTSIDPGRGPTLNFWHFIIIVLIFLLPSRSLGALGEERDANTLDTLVLTRLTPWRIVWGKWCAAAAQAAVTAVAIVPHLLVRYLNGGSNFVRETMVLMALLLLSGAVSGVFTAFSVIKSALARNGLALAVMAAAYSAVCVPLVILPYYGSNGLSAALLGEIMVLCVWAALFSLWHAAGFIAPAAANITTPRRLTSLAAVLVFSTIAAAASPSGDMLFQYGLPVMLGVVSMVEMGERLSFHPGVAAAFTRRGLAGKLAGLFLRPGWNSGVLFCSALWGLAGFVSGMWGDSAFLSAASLCFFPVTARLIFPEPRRIAVSTMVLLATLSQVIRVVLLSFDASPDSIAHFVPGLYDPAIPHHFSHPSITLGWVGLALLQAVVSLAVHSRRKID